MITLQVRNGDLVVGPKGHAVVEGRAKVIQDLGLALREPLGIDRFHPEQGSMLHRYIGEPVGVETESLVRAEIYRIVRNVMAIQQETLTKDSNQGARPRFTTSEVIASIDGVDIVQEFDRYHVRVRLRMLSGEEIQQVVTVQR